MSTGQTLLTLGALILLTYTAMNANRLYLNSVRETTGAQVDSDAVNYGKDLSEWLFARVYDYEELEDIYGHLNDVTDPDSRCAMESSAGEVLYATVDLSGEQELIHGVPGRIVTITVYGELNNSYAQQARYHTAMMTISGETDDENGVNPCP